MARLILHIRAALSGEGLTTSPACRSSCEACLELLHASRLPIADPDDFNRWSGCAGQQFYLMTNSPEREAAFQRLKAQHGSIWKFHGSPFYNWHSILRTNLRNVSGTQLMRVGQALGKGIYLASSSATSRCGILLTYDILST